MLWKQIIAIIMKINPRQTPMDSGAAVTRVSLRSSEFDSQSGDFMRVQFSWENICLTNKRSSVQVRTFSLWGYNSTGRVLALQAKCSAFKSQYPHWCNLDKVALMIFLKQLMAKDKKKFLKIFEIILPQTIFSTIVIMSNKEVIIHSFKYGDIEGLKIS